MTKDNKTPEPAPTPKQGEAEAVANIGHLRVQTAEEVQQAKEGDNQPVAPFDGDPKEAHALASERATREGIPREPEKLPAVGMPPELDAKGKAKKEELYPIRLLFDWWDGQGVRHSMDSIVEIPLNEAKKLMDEGKGEYAGKLSPSSRK